jgi:hypothetical protein
MLAAKKATQVAESKRPVYDQDGWEVKKGAKQEVQVPAPVKQQVQQASVHRTQQKSTYSVLAAMMQQEEQQEIAIETKRTEYNTHFPGGKPVIVKPSWGNSKPNWSAIAKLPPAPQPKLVQQQQKQQKQTLRPIQEDDAHSSEDDRATPEPSSPAEKSWGWSGDWNDCPL